VLKRNWDVSWFHVAHIVLFAGAAWVFVDRYGIVGYGYAEMAALLGYPVIHWFVARAVGSPAYGVSAMWWASLAIGLFWRQLGPWAIAAPVIAILSPPSIRQIKTFYAMFRRTPRHAI
jgi:PST family polysaccharide transporter